MFRKIEIEEENKNVSIGEHVCVKRSLEKKVIDGEFKIDNSHLPSIIDEEFAHRIHYWTKKGKPVPKGVDIPSLPVESQDMVSVVDDFAYNDSFDHQSQPHFETDMSSRDISIFHSTETTAMMDNDSAMTQLCFQSTQESQKLSLTFHKNSMETKDKTIVDLARQGLKAAESDSKVYDYYLKEMKTLVNNVSQKAILSKKENEDGELRIGLHMVESGKSKKKREARKPMSMDN